MSKDDTHTNKQTRTKGISLSINGALSGVLSSVITQPFDVIKTNMIGVRKTSDVIASTRTSMTQTMKLIWKDEGIFGLYRGTIPTIYRVAPGAAIYYGLLHEMNKWSKNFRISSDYRILENFIIGGAARGVATTIVSPITVVKTRFEVAPLSPEQNFFTKGGVWSTLKHIYKTEGVRKGLFNGVLPTLARDVPYSGLFFSFQNKINDIITTAYAPESIRRQGEITNIGGTPFWITPVSSAASAFLASLITYPFDVVRTRLQLKSDYGGVWKSFAIILKEEGPATFFRGITPRLMKRTVSSAVTWTLLEQFVNFFERSFKK
ncbi:SLC25A38 [Acrasis kona]|uniref:SLC25A38 n=1 Tax=Acrasis kona TaxID=1008807 RepID=A0AAW2YSY0_9EUKA